MASRSGYMLRKDQALAAAGEKPCEQCEHPARLHLELPAAEWAIVDGELVQQANPDYRAFHFHCRAEGCDCVLDRSG